jgi:glycosyltransferase involved in cell wall biosynthesis
MGAVLARDVPWSERERKHGPLDVSIILPVHNEEDNVEVLLAEIEKAMVSLNKTYEVIAIDDRSTDRSVERLSNYRSSALELHVVILRRHVGQTGAWMAGFAKARGDVLVTMDADRQNDPGDLPVLLGTLEREGADVVTGWRHKRKDGLLLRKLPSIIANFLVRVVTGTKVRDLGCSLKAYRREAIGELRLYGEMHRFIIPLLEQLGAQVVEIPVNHRPRTHGRSKYGLGRTLKVTVDLLTVWFIGGFQQKPSYIFGGAGLCLLPLSFLCFGITLWEKVTEQGWVHKNPLFLCGIFLALSGLQLIATGLLSELLIRTYFESSNKTPYSNENMHSNNSTHEMKLGS